MRRRITRALLSARTGRTRLLVRLAVVSTAAAALATVPAGLAAAGSPHHYAPHNGFSAHGLVRPRSAAHPWLKAGPRLSARPSFLTSLAASVHQTFVVDTSGDPTTGTSCAAGHPAGTCSLRAAVAAVDADTGHTDQITIPSGMTVTLSQGSPLDLTNSMVIAGTGAKVDGGGSEVFDQFSSPAVQIIGLEVTNGITTGDGGGMYCSNGTLDLQGVTFDHNVAADGGGLYTASSCQLWIDSSVFKANTAIGGGGTYPAAYGDGGGLYTYGSAYITGSTFGDPSCTSSSSECPNANRAEEGAGLYNYDGNLTITNSSFNGNASPSTYGYGVGIYNDEVMDLSGSTVDYNYAPYGADGVGMDLQYVTSITGSEISHNTAAGDNTTYGGGLYDDGDTTTLSSVTLAGNTVAPTAGKSVYGGALLSYAYNFTFTGGTISNQTNGVDGQSDYIQGGAMYLDGSHATVRGVSIANTSNDSLPNEYPEGGAIYVNEYTTLQKVSIDTTTNKGYYVYGGAIYNDDYSTFDSLTVKNTSNHATYSGGGYIAGGAIYNDGENFAVNNSSFAGTTNLADTGSSTPSSSSSEIQGGFIYNDYESTMDHVSVTNTTSHAVGGNGYIDGGGIYNDESLNLRDTQLIGTSVQADSYVEGGLVYNDDRWNATNVTIGGTSRNPDGSTTPSKVDVLGGPNAGTPYADGSIFYNDSQASVVNTTLDDTTTSVPSGGDHNWGIENADLLQLTNSTIANDSLSGPSNATWLLYGYGGSQAGLLNTILSSTTPAINCSAGVSAKILSSGHNLDSGSSCGFTNPGDLQNTAPMVKGLANNGGAVLTGALAAGSPAIDAGTNSGCPPTDARGVTRPQGKACDIGAYESKKATLALSVKAPAHVHAGASFKYVLKLTNKGPDSSTGTTLVDHLPAGATLKSVTTSRGSCRRSGSPAKITCALGTLNRGSGATVTIKVSVRHKGKKTSRATASNKEGSHVSVHATTRVVASGSRTSPTFTQ